MCPRLKMVYGSCQHRICVDCLYSNLDVRRPSMQKCPTCQKIDAFPLFRPDIPEDNIESQWCLGVRECTNSGCQIEVWEWELEDHLLTCPNKIDSPAPSSTRRQSFPAHNTVNHSKKQKKELYGRLTRSRSIAVSNRLRPRRRRVLVRGEVM